MNLEFSSLSELQRDVLLSASNVSHLKRARGGYVAIAGGKAFTTRTVFALQRWGLLTLQQDGQRAMITRSGNELLRTGHTTVLEEQAG
ncbi:hypothetical protein [Arenimonas oryziterrae]|uniref:Uncharacterized protein n=1 Tax=Arenimonas oryziterrae DSM 21050 = YC6267 TaxID=1121015 RepID=A0A091AQ72_9GAMM|nr:hypothetical protein [Arenimonas oryziterrae]KFN42318.1 hypothetical protein N789_14085 [Arenimonas oryziterrae DSM 21050 = YC6267]